MPKKIDIKPKYMKMVKDILREQPPTGAKVWAFGSRTTGKAKKFSDLDLLVASADGERLGISIEAKLYGEFEESLLPYRVEITDMATISPAFKKHIEPDLVELPF